MKNLGLLRKGFTLIELLVVITIIGILATGATTTYTSQIQKARDSTRVSDIKTIQGGIEQFYQDSSVYPSLAAFRTEVGTYTQLAEDPKKGQSATGSALDYVYMVAPDANGVAAQEYETSIVYEQAGNTNTKSTLDGWNDAKRHEFGIDTPGNSTAMTAAVNGSWVSTAPCVSLAGANVTCATAGAVHVIRR